ncbi:hypothetical protein L539_0285 [Bordetella hinzii 5132]|nr:hypothetical protein L539_0285 [Bordetella hinzii 5132]
MAKRLKFVTFIRHMATSRKSLYEAGESKYSHTRIGGARPAMAS